MKDLFRLEEKVAVVAGGVGLIGRALVEGLATFGAHVFIADINDEAAEEYARQLGRRGLRASSASLDIRDFDSIAACVSGVLSSSGSIDVWVNSAYPKIQEVH